MRRRAFLSAFPATLPVMAGYLFLGFGFGVILGQAGYGAPWALYMSAGIYAGAMQYAAVDLLVSGAALWESALMALMVNARHLFYGLSMAQAYRDTGRLKPYLAFSLTDETFALLSLTPVPEGVSGKWFYFFVSAMNQLYWVAGSLLGSLAGRLIPLDLHGIEFSMTALFMAMLIEQWRRKASRLPALIGLACSLFCLILLGPERFTAPAMLLITGVLFLFRGRISDPGEGKAPS